MARFCNKRTSCTVKKRISYCSTKPVQQKQEIVPEKEQTISQVNTNVIVQENNEEKIQNDMTTSEKIQQAAEILSQPTVTPNKFKRVRKDKGLIERTESSKIVLTEDNKELLVD